MLILPAPAKINLYLHVTGKRADGYHTLDTVFQAIDLQDTVRLANRPDGHIVLHTPIAGLADAQHLAVRAACALKNHTNCAMGADIWVDKRIPSGAGLGGGSSDAASTLLGLNSLWGCGLTSMQLQALALQLGADVPFFCSQFGTARAQGIGEQLQAIPTPNKAYIIAYPNCHVATPAVFNHPDLAWREHELARHQHNFQKAQEKTRDNSLQKTQQNTPPFASDVNFAETIDSLDAFAEGFSNDLQAVATLIAPPIAQISAWFACAPNVQGVRMSGSGSAVFAQFAQHHDAAQALVALNNIRPANSAEWLVWVVKPLLARPVSL